MSRDILIMVISSLTTGGLVWLIKALKKRLIIKPKTDAAIKEIKDEQNDFKAWRVMMSKCVLALMVTARDGHANGEIKDALNLYNAYMNENV